MKNKILYVAAFLFVTSSLNITYASSNMSNPNISSMKTHAETISNTSKSQEPTIKLDINKIIGSNPQGLAKLIDYAHPTLNFFQLPVSLLIQLRRP